MKTLKSGNIQVLETKKDYLEAYYYKGYKPNVWPKKYPCILIQEDNPGGLMGDYVSHSFSYIPDDVDLDSFFVGFVKGYNSKE